MPIVSQYQHATLPAWYAGQQQRLGERAEGSATSAYQPYKGKRLAAFLNPDISRAYDLARQEGVDQPYLNEANMMSREGANATFDPTTMIEPYLDPYRRHVVEQMRDLANKGFTEQLLPRLQREFISTGNYGGTQNQAEVDRLTAEHERELNNAMIRALSEGYGQARDTAGKMFESGAARKLEGAGLQKELGPLAQAGKLADVEALRQIGTEQRDREQAERDLEYQDFQRQENFPYRMQQHQAGILTGMPQQYQDVYKAEQTPGAPQLNTVGQLGALAANIYGARMAGGYGRKKGGTVKAIKTYKDEGLIDLGGRRNPIDYDMEYEEPDTADWTNLMAKRKTKVLKKATGGSIGIKKPKVGLSKLPLMQGSMARKPKIGGSLGIKHAKNKDKMLYGKSNRGRSVS